MTTHLEALRALVRKWRANEKAWADQGYPDCPQGECADELEAALGSGPDGKMGEAVYGRKEIGSPVGYVDRGGDSGGARFCRLNDLEHVPSNTKVYAIPDPALKTIRQQLQRMINSAQVLTDGDVVTGYKIKTGALHAIIGAFADADESLTIPANLTATSTPNAESPSQPPVTVTDVAHVYPALAAWHKAVEDGHGYKHCMRAALEAALSKQ
jgi:hypothetical protein